MRRFLSFVSLTLATSAAWALVYTAYLIVGLNVPRSFLFMPKTEDPTLNNSIYHWSQEALTFDTIIIGSSMALNNFDPSYFHSKSIGVFGSWGLMPHRAIEAFSEVISLENKHFLIPLSLPEAAKSENISNPEIPEFSVRLPRHDEWAQLESLKMDTLSYTNIRLAHNGNAPLATVSEGFHIDPQRWDFIYSVDTNNVNSIIETLDQLGHDVTFVLLPWRDSCDYPLMTEWMSGKGDEKGRFIDLRNTPIDQSSWLDGTHLDYFGARALFIELRGILARADTPTSKESRQ